MQIQILNVTASNPTGKNNKPYSKLEVAFKNLTFQGKVEGKQLMGFGDTKPAHDVLILAQPGDVYEVEIVKKDGYNNWVNAVKSGAGAAAPQPAGGTIGQTSAASSGFAKAAYTAPKSTYETPEERAKKQIYIVRQSSVGSAIELLSVGSKARPDIKEVLDYAKQIEEFVFGNANNQDADVLTGTDGFKDLDTMDDVPY